MKFEKYVSERKIDFFKTAQRLPHGKRDRKTQYPSPVLSLSKMAMPRVLCRARLWFYGDLSALSKYTPVTKCAVVTKCVQVQMIRPFRTNFSVNLVTKEKPEKDKNKDLSSSTSSSSSDSDQTDDDSDADEADVTVEYHRGLPRITVPLPSRKEKCSFTLKPISNTVGDFLDMLRKEDKGIDRVVCKTRDGIRIASSNTIETLLDDDFRLIINDNSYNVNTPRAERLTGEEVQSLNDVKNLVNKLYEALHVQDHQLTKERELMMQLETLRQEVQPLEDAMQTDAVVVWSWPVARIALDKVQQASVAHIFFYLIITNRVALVNMNEIVYYLMSVVRNEIEVVAHKRSNWLAWAGLGLMSVQFGILARLTWWEYSWDIMEPVTYFVTYGTAMAAYAYFVLTKEEYVLNDVRDRQHLIIMHKKAKKTGVDLTKYNQLKEEMHKIEYKLKKLRNPLKLHLPPKPNKPPVEAVPETSSTTSPDPPVAKDSAAKQ